MRSLQVVSLFILLTIPSLASAEYVCAQVWPCNEDGSLQEVFNNPEDVCFEHYYLQCERMQSELEINSCELDRGALLEEIERLKKKLKKQKRRSRR